MVTFFRPLKVQVKGTGRFDFYLKPGEPIGLRHWCHGGVKTMFGLDIPIGESVRILLGEYTVDFITP